MLCCGSPSKLLHYPKAADIWIMHAMALATQNVCYLMNKDCMNGGSVTSPWKLIVVRAAVLCYSEFTSYAKVGTISDLTNLLYQAGELVSQLLYMLFAKDLPQPNRNPFIREAMPSHSPFSLQMQRSLTLWCNLCIRAPHRIKKKYSCCESYGESSGVNWRPHPCPAISHACPASSLPFWEHTLTKSLSQALLLDKLERTGPSHVVHEIKEKEDMVQGWGQGWMRPGAKVWHPETLRW